MVIFWGDGSQGGDFFICQMLNIRCQMSDVRSENPKAFGFGFRYQIVVFMGFFGLFLENLSIVDDFFFMHRL